VEHRLLLVPLQLGQQVRLGEKLGLEQLPLALAGMPEPLALAEPLALEQLPLALAGMPEQLALLPLALLLPLVYR
jgi:hypothetical protein